MKRGGFLAGFLTCLLLVGVTTTAYAAGIIATPFSELNQRITLNGQEISLTGYNIGGNNYFKLRDIGKEVGFNVSWNGSTRTVEIDTSTSYSEDTPRRQHLQQVRMRSLSPRPILPSLFQRRVTGSSVMTAQLT